MDDVPFYLLMIAVVLLLAGSYHELEKIRALLEKQQEQRERR